MKKLIALLLCAVLALTLISCSKSADNLADAEAGNAADFQYYANTSGAVTESYKADTDAAAGSSATQNEKVIKTVELSVETKEYDTYVSALSSGVNSLGGYIETSTADFGNGYSSNRYANYTVRIPSDKLDEFLTAAGENGTITRKTENQQNVTLEYVDLESRIEAYKTEKVTLTNLLEKAASLENVLAIQERLSEVNYQIETYTSQLKVLENRVSYSTVTLRIYEVERVTETEPTVWSRIKNTFADNLDDLVEWFKDVVVGFVGGLPILIPLCAVIAAAALIIRRTIKKRKAKRNMN
ncbi:MAG: DUF4349 domain-containing protein [Ruminococcaceae bacterium]|nr:DUF4349 domain-containing protein [Oscillospiraceae bacterium]